MAEVQLPSELRERVGRIDSGKQLIAGIRPENFEDASLLGDDVRGRGATFKAKVDVLESMGAELYAHFTVSSEAELDSDELRELAEDAGAGEVPGGGEAGRVVARLAPEATVKEGEEAELWVDASHIQLFDPDGGDSLTASD
jgi:multiple sugar transport system ATP-binding protein